MTGVVRKNLQVLSPSGLSGSQRSRRTQSAINHGPQCAGVAYSDSLMAELECSPIDFQDSSMPLNRKFSCRRVGWDVSKVRADTRPFCLIRDAVSRPAGGTDPNAAAFLRFLGAVPATRRMPVIV